MNNKEELKVSAYYRMASIRSYLTEMDQELSVSDMAELLDVPKDVIREDVKYLIQSDVLPLTVWPAEEDEDTDSFLQELFAGYHDDVKLLGDTDMDCSCFSLYLSAFEHYFLDQMVNHKSNTNLDLRFKKLGDMSAENQMENSVILQRAIRNRMYIEYDYEIKSGKVHFRDVMPLFLVKIVEKEQIYLVLKSDQTILEARLDKMTNIKDMGKIYPVLKDIESIREVYESRWAISASEEPFRFSMIVYDEANLINRLKQQLSHRTHAVWSKMDDGNALYEDAVSGYDQLKNWVLSLGSSVKVIEPARLAEDIVQSALERMHMYEERKRR